MSLGFRVISSGRLVAYPVHATTRSRIQEHFGKNRIWWYDSNDDATFYFLAPDFHGDNFVEEGDYLIHDETADELFACRAKDFNEKFIPLNGL
jgi:hypothetical protein